MDILTALFDIYAVKVMLVSFVISLIAGKVGIPLLRKMKAKQSIREEGPERHQGKAGTPTMGGLFILSALTIATLMYAEHTRVTYLLLLLTVGHGLLGFADDFIKAVKKRNLGLTAKEKFAGQLLLSAVFCYAMIDVAGFSTTVNVPGTSLSIDLGYAYYVLAFCIIVGTTNAVNLTDGLDGLAAGTTAIAAGVYTLIGMLVSSPEVTAFSAAVCGAVIGFAVYNIYPAKVFMGDTGSLALGGAFAAAAIVTKTELLLVVIGGVFVVEALSVIIQVVSFRTTGKRVFRMSPLHHHFELSGWSERKTVYTFWFAGVLLAVAGAYLAIL